MGQIVYGKQVPRFCNLVAIQTGGSKADTVLDNGEIWLVDTTNTTKENDGAGVYDAYIIGDGSKAASALTVEYLTARVDLSAYSTTTQMNAAIQSAISGKQDTISDLSTIRSGASAGATAYQKPGTGIPPTDLASAVQTSLGKADTAIQSVTVGTTTTGAAGTNASVTNTGTATEPVLSFTIPQGAQGIQGIQGVQGERGPVGANGVTTSANIAIITGIDKTTAYDSTKDVASAEAVQDLVKMLGTVYYTQPT